MTAPRSYTLGYGDEAVRLMTRRTAETHAAFFLPSLKPGMELLDCGCGQGTITVGLARRVTPGTVVGVDAAENQVQAAEARAIDEGVSNVRYQTANVTALPFLDGSFDAVFSHALLEHLPDPIAAAREFHRVLKPGGIVGVRCPDWGGFVLAPPDPPAEAAFAAFRRLQEAAGGDTTVGRKLGSILQAAGFGQVRMGAEYEVFPEGEVIGDFLVRRVESTDHDAAEALRAWSRGTGGLIAVAWLSAIGSSPGPDGESGS